MLKNFKNKFKKNFEIYTLIILIFITAIFTSYFNYQKNLNDKAYINFIDNVYFKKTLNHIFDNLDPKYKKIKHKIKSGETFDKILEGYSIEKSEIIKIKNTLKKKVNLNKLNTKQIIQFNLNKTNNKIEEFTYQTSNTQRIQLLNLLESMDFKLIFKEILEKMINFKLCMKFF